MRNIELQYLFNSITTYLEASASNTTVLGLGLGLKDIWSVPRP